MRKNTRWGLTALIALVLIGLATRPYWKAPEQANDIPKGKGGPKKTLNVMGQIVRTETLEDQLPLSGNLLPDEEVELSFETSGKITHIYFTEGSTVRKGELLAKVNDAPLQAQLKRLQAQLQLAQNRVYRQDALLKKEAVSQEALEEVKTSLATLNADMDLVKANLAQTELRAPFDGIIGLRRVSRGAYASPSTVVATLTRISPLKIEFSVPERYSGTIQKGTPLRFTIEGQLDTMQARVYAADSKVDVSTHTYSVRALYPNPGGKVKPGRFANLYLQSQRIPHAMAVPSEAIVSEMGIDKVFLYKSGKAVPTEIVKGLRTESKVQVLKGIAPGDTVITTGIMQLRTGLEVKLDGIER